MDKIAIIGAGIAGLTCAYLLHQKYEITLFEANSYVGGHTNTIDVVEDGKNVAIDTGFIVFNKKTYPNFLKLLEFLNVAYQPTNMSFSLSCEQSGLEYNGSGLNKFFAQRRNFFRPSHYFLLADIIKFNNAAKLFLENNDTELSLKTFIEQCGLSKAVIHHYLLPMAAAVWSSDPQKIFDFPAYFLLQFWQNHGLLEIKNRPQWYVIKNGSRCYVEALIQPFKERIYLNAPVTKITRNKNKATVYSQGHLAQDFDIIICATHSDQALNMLEEPSKEEQNLLSTIHYQANRTILHTDVSVLPKRKLAWACWNYRIPKNQKAQVTVTYNMNILQSLSTRKVYNVTLNPCREIPPEHIIKEIQYDHPVFSKQALIEQQKYPQIMGQRNTFFCGAYMGNGFHEDGVVSALKVCHTLGETL